MARFYRDDILHRLGCGKDTFYKLKNHLGLQGNRDENKAVFFSEDDLAALELLKQHLDEGGKLDDFEVSALAIASDSNLAESSVDISPEDPEEIPEIDPLEGVDLEQLIREAANLRGEQIVTPQLVKLAIAGQLAEEELPPEVQERVKAIRAAANPKFQADAIASQLLTKWRAGRIGQSGNIQNSSES